MSSGTMNSTIVCFIVCLGLLFACQDSSTEQQEEGPHTPPDQPKPELIKEQITERPPISGYYPRGIGGGSAMDGFSMSPYANLWFVGTDMGTLFRSIDNGKTWDPIDHEETYYDYRLQYSANIGYSSDGKTVFHAPKGREPVKSIDTGLTWEKIPNFPNFTEDSSDDSDHILYFLGNSFDPDHIYAATLQGFYFSHDKGDSWKKAKGIKGKGVGTFIDYKKGSDTIYHAAGRRIYKSQDGGATFKRYSYSKRTITSFTGGRDSDGLVLAFVDNNGKKACSWSDDQDTIEHCGYVWISKNNGKFKRLKKEAGDYIAMAENNSSTIYVAGSRDWERDYGTKIWKSTDQGASWQLVFHQYDQDQSPYAPWDASMFEYSAVGLDVGWWDSGYRSFAVNQRNPNHLGGTGNFFLHTSLNGGDHWQSPFTIFADEGERTKGKFWQSNGLEVTSAMKIKFNPYNPQMVVAAFADIRGMTSLDGGISWRINKHSFNSEYDFAFDQENPKRILTAVGNLHDFPYEWQGNVLKHGSNYTAGGIYESLDEGKSWNRITGNTDSDEFYQYVSIAFDSTRRHIYAGSQGLGVLRSTDDGESWSWFNKGLPPEGKIIPKIEINPHNGNVYILLTGNAGEKFNDEQGVPYENYSNIDSTGIYFLDVQNNQDSWVLLRGTVHRPSNLTEGQKLWCYPTSFAVDFSSPGDSILWLTDYEKCRNWLATGIWKSTDRGANWYRSYQYTHPINIEIDPTNSSSIHVAGSWAVDGGWGNGGAIYTTDQGNSWKKNDAFPLKSNLHSLSFDPNDCNKIFYGFFGGAMLYGDNPY